MKRITINEPSAGELRHMTPAEIDATPGALHFEQTMLPDLGSGPILPAWLSDRLRRLFGRAA
ncbi:MAG: hypothetical protein ACRDK7_04580 [Solirubrobacteraceae bacterium]